MIAKVAMVTCFICYFQVLTNPKGAIPACEANRSPTLHANGLIVLTYLKSYL